MGSAVIEWDSNLASDQQSPDPPIPLACRSHKQVRSHFLVMIESRRINGRWTPRRRNGSETTRAEAAVRHAEQLASSVSPSSENFERN
eukprot:4825960-Pleurochrysis_carterae.AAC.2